MIDDPNQVANFVLNFYWNFCFENTVAHLAVKAYCTSESKLNSKAAEYIYIFPAWKKTVPTPWPNSSPLVPTRWISPACVILSVGRTRSK